MAGCWANGSRAIDLDCRAARATQKWDLLGRGSALHARQRGQSTNDVGNERAHTVVIDIGWERDAHGGQAHRAEARVYGAQRLQTASEQHGLDEQDHRERKLRRDEQALHPARAAPALAGAQAHERCDPGAPCDDRGDDAEQKSGERRACDGEGQHTTVERNAIDAWEACRRGGDQSAYDRPGDCGAEHGAGESDGDALHKELPDESPTTGSQRGTCRHLTSTSGGLAELQNGGVDAGDEQQEPDSADEHEQRTARAPALVGLPLLYPGAERGVGGDGADDGRCLLARVSEGRTRSEARERSVVAVASFGDVRRILQRWQPERRRVARAIDAKPRRENADNGIRSPAEQEATPDERRVSAVTRRPRVPAHERDARAA